jgi:hypothetical protein
MTTFKKGDRVQLIAHPMAHGTVVGGYNINGVTIRFDGGHLSYHLFEDTELVPFPIGTVLEQEGQPNITVTEELGNTRFVLYGDGQSVSYHISELRRDWKVKGAGEAEMKEGDAYFHVTISYGEAFVSDSRYRKDGVDHARRDCGNFFLSRKDAENKALEVNGLFEKKV